MVVLGAAQSSNNIAKCRQKIDHRHGLGTGNFRHENASLLVHSK